MLGIQDSGQKIVTSGLILNLDAGQLRSYSGSGTTWTDLSGKGNSCTLTNLSYSSTNGGVIEFNGTEQNPQYGTIPTNTDFNLQGNFHINIWFYADLFSGIWEPLVAKGDSTWRVSRVGNNFPYTLHFATNGISNTALDSASSINLDTWYNVACNYDGSTKKIYLNGVEDASVSATGNVNTNANDVGIGYNDGPQPDRFWDGYIAIVMIYSQSLSATQVGQNYNAVRSRFGL
jgi:hypothetical protein